MTKFRALSFVSVAAVLLLCSNAVGNSFDTYIQGTMQFAVSASQVRNAAHAQSLASANRKAGPRMTHAQKVAAEKQAMQAYYAKLIPTVQPDPGLSHLPKVTPISADESQNYIRQYDKAMKALRPNTTYVWKRGDGRASEIVTNQQHVDAVAGNWKLVLWYRAQLEDKCGDFKSYPSDHWLKELLDNIVATYNKSVSTPQVSLGGPTKDLQVNLPEKEVREQLSVVYRYLQAKFQLYENWEQFAPADAAMMGSLVKLIYLYGGAVDSTRLDEMTISLSATGKYDRSSWKYAGQRALLAMKAKADEAAMPEDERASSPAYHMRACTIPIPEKPKPGAPPPPEPRKVRRIIVEEEEVTKALEHAPPAK